jgi:hypothetical protein
MQEGSNAITWTLCSKKEKYISFIIYTNFISQIYPTNYLSDKSEQKEGKMIKKEEMKS